MTGAGPGDPVVGPLGPVEWVAIEFDGDRLAPAVVGPLAELVDAGTVRLLDAAVVHKDAGGAVRGAELTEAGVDFDAVDGDVLELLSDDDLDGIAAELTPGSTTLVLVWESLWASRFAGAVRAASGRLIAHDRIPVEQVQRALAALDTPETAEAAR